MTREAELGPRRVDLLVQVRLLDGRETWLLIHIEVQGQEEALFSQRMFVYFYRLFDHYRRPLVSLAVLTDERTTWRPATFALEQWGCTLHFSYPIVKLADWRGRQGELTASANPFATVLLAHLAAQATRGDVQARWGAKWALIRGLYDRGLAREHVLSLFRIIDWFLALPQDREQALWTAVRALEEEHKMPYVTSIERLGLERGRKEGREEGQAEERRALIRRAVLRRFGSIPPTLEARIAEANLDELAALFDQVLVAPDLEAL